MTDQIDLGDIAVDVVFKDIKNVHLSVYPPDGKVRMAAPARMSLDTLRVFAISKLAWIRQQQQKLRDQPRETPRDYLDRESHYLWGTRYLLQVVEQDASAGRGPAAPRHDPAGSPRHERGEETGHRRRLVSTTGQGRGDRTGREVAAHPGRDGPAALRAAHEDALGRMSIPPHGRFA
jgi:predicted metal-dependent hydrolase